jgi:hypothetical protein
MLECLPRFVWERLLEVALQKGYFVKLHCIRAENGGSEGKFSFFTSCCVSCFAFRVCDMLTSVFYVPCSAASSLLR